MSIIARRFQDELSNAVTWLSDRHLATPSRSVGYRFLWSMVAPLDAAMDTLIQGIQAPWPGLGDATALPFIGRSRGFIRGIGETDVSFSARLLAWLDKWRIAGSAEAIARAVHDHLSNRPPVTVVRRTGATVTVNADGTVTRGTMTWNWDGVSNPERTGYWSDLWIIVYGDPYARTGTWGDGALWGSPLGLAHDVPGDDRDAIKSLVAQWKAAHSFVRAIIWTPNTSAFVATDGTWGEWGGGGSGSRTASSRNTTSYRYWEEL